jgi:sigma-B regulation protein RsbU (phosphoserine phosphatase)
LSTALHIPQVSEADDRQRLLAEIESLRAEVNLLRRRDETLNFYMFRLDEELRLAAKLQQDFLPKSLPEVGQVRFHTLFRPAGYVSGDLYDVMRLDESHLGFYMADAVGHGMPAALLTMFIKNGLTTKQITEEGYRLLEPGEALGKLNRAMIDQNLSGATFATAFYGTIDAQTLMCKFARAGHPLPTLLRKDGTVSSIESDGGLLGIFPEEVYAEGQVLLRAGDRLFICSDGIEVCFVDEKSTDNHEWRRQLQARAHLPTEQIVTEISEALDKDTGSLAPKDDVSMVVIEIK